MTVTVPPAPTTRAPMTSTRTTALVAGLFYVLTFVSIPTLALYGPLKSDPRFILGAGSDTAVYWGCLLEVIVALAGIGTAVTLFPVVKRQNEALALGFVTTRVLEAAMIFFGVASLLSLLTLRQGSGGAAGADAAALVSSGQLLVANYNRAFLLGQSLMPGLNALLLGTLMFRSGLVPRALPLMGLIGAPVHLAAVITTMFGLNDPIAVWPALAMLPIAAWELSLGLWMLFKGFRPSPITDGAH